MGCPLSDFITAPSLSITWCSSQWQITIFLLCQCPTPGSNFCISQNYLNHAAGRNHLTASTARRNYSFSCYTSLMPQPVRLCPLVSPRRDTVWQQLRHLELLRQEEINVAPGAGAQPSQVTWPWPNLIQSYHVPKQGTKIIVKCPYDYHIHFFF